MEISTPVQAVGFAYLKRASDIKTTSRSPEMQFFGHGDEVFKMTEFHKILIATSC
jgi:hypothetical protein